MTWARALLWIIRIELLPGCSLDIIPVEIINAIITIITSEDKDSTTVNDCSMAISRTGWLGAAISVKLRPGVCRETELVEVVATICAIVTTEDVEVVVDGD